MSAPVQVCYGGGTDSTAMLIEMVRRGERIDLVTFADTGAELPHTYKTVELMDVWLRSQGYPGVTTVRYTRKRDGKVVTLEETIRKNNTLPALAFGWHTCSIRYKIDPQVAYAKQFPAFKEAWARGEKVIRCIGYDASPADTKRACRSTTKFPDLAQYDNRYPLREWGWDRERCLAEILKEGLPDPGKSSCYFCPARKKPELDHMAEHYPEFMEKALEIEKIAMTSGKITSPKMKGMGRSYNWGEHIKERTA